MAITKLMQFACHAAHSPPRPALRARTIASERSCRLSLVRMFETWLRTVFVLSVKCAAMRAFDQPWAMRSSSSRSRAVRSGNGSGRRGAETNAIDPLRDRRPEHRLAAIDGLDRAHDLVGACALEQVAARAGAHRGEHRLVVLQHRQHEDSGVRARGEICRVASMPLRSGMWRSITTTSGCSCGGSRDGLVAARRPRRRPRPSR